MCRERETTERVSRDGEGGREEKTSGCEPDGHGPRILAGLTGDSPTELADQAVGPDPDPLVPDARRLLPYHDFLRLPPGQTLDDQGTQAEEQSQEARIDPG